LLLASLLRLSILALEPRHVFGEEVILDLLDTYLIKVGEDLVLEGREVR
jgi:hypothetical protein